MFGYTVFDGKMWLTGGSTSGAVRDVWYSTNGSVWTQGAQPGWSAKRYHKMLVYDNKMWVIGGWDNQRDVWYTTNGSTWTRATATASWSARTGLALKFLITKCGFLVALRIMMFGILLTALLGQKPTITLIGVHEVMLGRLYLVINFGLCVVMTELKTFQMYGTVKYS